MLEMMKETEKILFNGWTVTVQRKAFRRNLSIYLHPQKPIRVLAPKLVSHKVIEDFLLAKKDWIEKHQNKFKEIELQKPQRKIKAHSKIPFLGIERSIKPVVTLLKKPFVSLDQDHFLIHVPRNDWGADVFTQEHSLDLVRDFFQREAKKYLTERIHELSKTTGLKPTKLTFREQKTRWGSCSSRGTISLNWRMIVLDPLLIDSILIHELCHLKHLNHSNRFWELVESFDPDYLKKDAEIKKHQFEVEFLDLKTEK